LIIEIALFLADYRLQPEREDDCSRPHLRQADAVLAAVKAWPGSAGVCRTRNATARLDAGCARASSSVRRSGRRNGPEVEPRNDVLGYHIMLRDEAPSMQFKELRKQVALFADLYRVSIKYYRRSQKSGFKRVSLPTPSITNPTPESKK
jgi:hypothetical protein